MAKMSKKDISNEQLARMMAKGFEEMATKADLAGFKREIRQDIENITLKFDHVAQKFEVKDLEKRMDVVEKKLGVK